MKVKGQSKAVEINREETLRRLKRPIERPEITHGAGLFRAARQLGWVQPMPMADPAPISLAAILPAVGMPGSALETWRDAETVARMCEAFSAGLRDGKDPLSMPPWERS